MTSADSSLFVVTTMSLVRPHGISRSSFLVYLPDLPIWVTVTFWTSLLCVNLSVIWALVSGFCSSGYDFAIASSLPHLTMRNLQITSRFVGNYALCGLSPQTNGMPVIHKKGCERLSPHPFLLGYVFVLLYQFVCFQLAHNLVQGHVLRLTKRKPVFHLYPVHHTESRLDWNGIYLHWVLYSSLQNVHLYTFSCNPGTLNFFFITFSTQCLCFGCYISVWHFF